MIIINCSICYSHIPFNRGVKIGNGKICKRCAEKIPDVLLSYVPSLYSYDIEQIIKYEDTCVQKFSKTASCGTLVIDEIHGLFCLTKKPDKLKNCAVFRFLDLDEIGYYCSNPKATMKGVVCDVVFSFRIDRLHLDCKITTNKQLSCASKRIDREHLSWNEPGVMSLFRNMINQSIKNAEERYQKEMEPNFINKASIERFKAMSLFMLEEGFTVKEVKQQRNTLLKAFHPDVSGAPPKYAAAINEAYSILIAEARKGETK